MCVHAERKAMLTDSKDKLKAGTLARAGTLATTWMREQQVVSTKNMAAMAEAPSTTRPANQQHKKWDIFLHILPRYNCKKGKGGRYGNKFHNS
jgi:hypothetical protein